MKRLLPWILPLSLAVLMIGIWYFGFSGYNLASAGPYESVDHTSYYYSNGKHVAWGGYASMSSKAVSKRGMVLKGSDPETFEEYGLFDGLERMGVCGRDKNQYYANENIIFEVSKMEFIGGTSEDPTYARAKDNSAVFSLNDCEKIDADAATFSMLEPVFFAKDARRVFAGTHYTEMIDTATAEVIPSSLYIKDKNGVFLYHRQGVRPYAFVQLAGAEPETFTLVGSCAKDKTTVFCQDKPMTIGDPESFVHLERVLYKDKTGIYVLSFFSSLTPSLVRIDADPSTFQILGRCMNAPGGEGKTSYAKDSRNVFCDGEKIEGADLATFEYLGTFPREGIPDTCGIAKDKNHVYCAGRRTEASPQDCTLETPASGCGVPLE